MRFNIQASPFYTIMNELNLFNQNQKTTISSLEISELTGKAHYNVLADIRKMLKGLEIQPTEFSGRYKDAKGEYRECFNLPKRESLILASGYNVKLRAAIIDRWAELEAKEQTKLPQTFSEALQLAADQAKQLELQAPKVQFAESVLESETSISIRNMAKMIGFGQNKFFEQLRNDKILIAIGNSRNTPYQRFIDAGYFELTERTWPNGEGITFVTRVTPKGQQYLTSKYAK